MASITTWVRIEPRARDADLAAGAEARIADPLWLLARQYQLGELDGIDAGSAISARTRLDAPRIDAMRTSATAAWTAVDPQHAPLDAVLADPSATLERRARDGRLLVTMLAATPAAAALFTTRFPLAVDAATLAAFDAPARRFYDVIASRVPDGDAVATAIAPLLAAGDLPAGFGIDAAIVAAVSATCRTWLARRTAAGSTSSGAWQPRELGYAFQLRAGGTVITAPTQASGRVSWYSGDAAPTTPAAPTPVVSTALPTHVHFRGAPPRRYWDLDDGGMRFHSITAGPGDVLRLLVVELGLTFADDWLVVPVELPAGSLARIVSHVVTDTFGTRQLVSSAGALGGGWRFCELARDPKLAGPVVLVAPTVSPLVGAPVDAIDFASDDVADILWAIDRSVLGQDGVARTVPAPTPAAETRAPSSYVLGPAIAPTYHPYRERVGAQGLELALSTIPGVPLADRLDLPATIAIGALPSRPAQLQMSAIVVRAPDGSYHRVLRHVVVPAAPAALPALDFDQVGG